MQFAVLKVFSITVKTKIQNRELNRLLRKVKTQLDETTKQVTTILISVVFSLFCGMFLLVMYFRKLV